MALENINKEEINLNKLLFGEKGEKINLVEILLQSVIKGASDESLKIIMNIFGLCGAMEPTQMEKYFSYFGLSLNHLEENLTTEEESFEENDFLINKFNPKTKSFNEIDLSMIDISTIKAVFSLMRILKENTQQELSTRIINHLGQLIKTLSSDEENLIEIILPNIIEVIPKFDLANQKNLFENIFIILNQFKNKVKNFIDDIIKLIKLYIVNENFYEIITKILSRLFEEFVSEMEKYYPFFIPICLSFLKTKKNNNKFISSLVDLFSLLTKNKNFSSYLGLLLEELSMVYIEATDEQILISLLGIFQKIVCLGNMHLYYPLIITIIIEKFKLIVNPKHYLNENQNNNTNLFFNILPINTYVDLNRLSKEKKLEYLFKTGPYQSRNILIISKSFDVFIAMNEVNAKNFIEYLPLIVNTCNETGIINYGEAKTKIKELLIDFYDYTFMEPEILKKRMKFQLCKINCIFGFNSMNNTQKKEIDIYNDNIWAKARFRQSVRIRKTKDYSLLIIKQFYTSYCSVE